MNIALPKKKIKKTKALKSKTEIKAPIVEAFKKYYQNPSVQFHIPGHTKGGAVLDEFKDLIGSRAVFLDTTDDFNNLGTLHPATGPIKEAQELAALAFGAEKTFFLLNGSTIGNIAIALSLTNEKHKVIIGRNCHRSIVTGMVLSGAEPLWVIPEKFAEWGLWGHTNAEQVEELLSQNPAVPLVWITSPTYEGVVSDIEAISKICKKYGAILAVDEAHGCLWGFNDELPSPAMQLGADIVVQSLHKTGGSFTQSSMLHVAKGANIDTTELEANLKLLHSTSPSYTLLASLDAARAYLQSSKGRRSIRTAISNAKYIRRRLCKLPDVNILSCEGLNTDPTKIFLKINGLSGRSLEKILEIEYHLEIESAADEGILILSNIGHTKRDAIYLCECIESIVKSNYRGISYLENPKMMPLCIPKMAMTPRIAHFKKSERVLVKDSIGRISEELIAECPPGISVLVPGEIIEEKHLPYLQKYDHISVIVD
ncbi:MAG: aminotransferase class V-fold PLP-dependent enzyme [bacterium]